MCTAYELGQRGGSFPARAIAGAIDELLAIRETRIVRPTLEAPVILPDGSLQPMSWGFRRSFPPKSKGGKPVKRTIVNSREDKLGGRMWSNAFRDRRCLVPVASFYEWVDRGGKKVPLRFERPDDSWLFIAGIWEDSEEHGKCFSMITTGPNEVVGPVHDRMPAVLPDEGIEPFLDGDLDEFGPSSVSLKFGEAENFLRN